ncbi:MAG: hypothetical protein Q4C64_07385 [Erysipelotrichia bacterium]|nr:hypothetical protein [Erysipelotrichia bacterium]
MTEYQWLLLAKLLDRYNSMKDSISLMNKMYPNCKRIQEMIVAFGNGCDAKDILNKNKTEKMIAYYSKFTSLNKAIYITFERQRRLKLTVKKILTDMSYQFILFVSSMVVLTLFMHTVLPTMVNSLQLETNNALHLMKAFKTVNVFKNIIIWTILLCSAGLLYLIVNKKIVFLWAFLHRVHLDAFFKVIATYFLVLDLKILLDNGISLNDSLTLIKLNKDNQLSGLLAFHFNNCLESGTEFEKSLDNEYFDEQFHAICLWGLKSDDFSASLNDYVEIIEFKMQRMLKRITKGLQIMCYLFVMVIIVLAYEVLMIPLDMLQDFGVN